MKIKIKNPITYNSPMTGEYGKGVMLVPEEILERIITDWEHELLNPRQDPLSDCMLDFQNMAKISLGLLEYLHNKTEDFMEEHKKDFNSKELRKSFFDAHASFYQNCMKQYQKLLHDLAESDRESISERLP